MKSFVLQSSLRSITHNATLNSRQFSLGIPWIARQSSRPISTSSAHRQAGVVSPNIDSSMQECKLTEDSFVYHGPLTKAFRNLKIFSLSSIVLTTCLSPVLFVVDSGLPMGARISLAAIALGTSGLSTALITWCAKPYVTTMRRFRPDKSGGAEIIELTTQSLFLTPRLTRVR